MFERVARALPFPERFRTECTLLAVTGFLLLVTCAAPLFISGGDAGKTAYAAAERATAPQEKPGEDLWLPSGPEDLKGSSTPGDPVIALLERISRRGYGLEEEVAAGSCKEDFERSARILEALDLRALRPWRRGENWLIVEAPYAPPDVPPDRREEVARVRLLKTPEGWKVERVGIVPFAAFRERAE